MRPEAFKRLRPFVQWPDRLRIRSVEHMPSVPAYPDESNLAQDLQVLRDRWLFEPQGNHDVTDGSFLGREMNQDLPAARLGDSVESIRSCSRSRHDNVIIFQYRNMSSALLRLAVSVVVNFEELCHGVQ